MKYMFIQLTTQRANIHNIHAWQKNEDEESNNPNSRNGQQI